MKRREDRPIAKHTLNLYTGDFQKLQILYSTEVGAAKIIRDLIRAHIRKVEEEAAQRVQRNLVDTLDITPVEDL